MRLVLKEFQSDAVDELLEKLRWAAREIRESGDVQAVGVSSPTGSGKTVIVTATIELLFQGDSDHKPLQDAVVLWITDQPQLNEQTRRKMLKDSSVLNETNLITIGPAFDQQFFTPRTVNFVNIQKLGRERDLITRGDERQYTIWETISNTVGAIPDRFFVVVDEAHRGMTESPQARREANTIIQKFIKGSAGEIPKVPIILGVSATLERFNTLIGAAGRTMRLVDVPIEDVRASGLLKDIVTLYHPTGKQPTDITMLRQAAKAWRKYKCEWERYCNEQTESVIKPILVVQVQDAAGKRVSKTDLDELVTALEDELGGLPPSAFAHAFQEGAPVVMADKSIRYLAASDIDADLDVQIVFFKTSLNTGWDCPRAEVMMSFRTAIDATSIAQLVGRMVRNPLARRVERTDFLNSVSLYLPHYDAAGLNHVIQRLTTPDPADMPPVDFRRGEDQIEVTRAVGLEQVFDAIENLPSYTIPSRRKTSQVRRLMKLARALAYDEIDDDAEEVALDTLLRVLRGEFERVRKTEEFNKIVHERKAEIRAVDWQVGLDVTDEDTKIVLDVSEEDIDTFFDMAGRRVGDEGLHKEWWRARRREQVDSVTSKLELIALSVDSAVRRKVEESGQRKVQEWLKANNDSIGNLPEVRRQIYEEIRARAKDPELRSRAFLPYSRLVRKAEDLWDRNIYVDQTGVYPGNLNKWESIVARRELERDKEVVWFRNPSKQPWSLTIPYRAGGKPTPFYPDFIFVREENGKMMVDLLDPHQIDLEDAPAKAAGLAEYAAKHADAYNRIELIIIRNAEIRSIDLMDEAKREKVREVSTKRHLELLYAEND
jgi:type III restriction enzyme